MIYQMSYKTKEGFHDMIMNSDGEFLTGLYFKNSLDEQKHIQDCEVKDLPIFRETKKWLDIYFSGKEPDFTPKFKIDAITPFRREVLNILLKIPYGKTITYNDIAKKIGNQRKIKKMSSQAVGNAVGWNPICIIIPCHRVVGSNGSLTGYGGGIKNKAALLTLEKNDMSKYFVPKKGKKL